MTSLIGSSAGESGKPLSLKSLKECCSVEEWYGSFKLHSPETVLVQGSDEFTRYLESDGIFMPREIEEEDVYEGDGEWTDEEEEDRERPPRNDNSHNEEEQGTQIGRDGQSSDDGGAALNRWAFPDITRRINAAIKRLGGCAIPKLNWTTPVDSGWVNCNSLKCNDASSVYKLLKSSVLCSHDLRHCEKSGSSVVVAVRKWEEIEKSREFRCFVFRGNVRGICQRDTSTIYEHLEGEKDRVRDAIVDFFGEVVRDNFHGGRFKEYAFDVYLTDRFKVKVLDFNVWGGETDSLLFDWDELGATGRPSDFVEFKIVETVCGPGNHFEFGRMDRYKGPVEAEMLQDGGMDMLRKLAVRPTDISDDDGDDEKEENGEGCEK